MQSVKEEPSVSSISFPYFPISQYYKKHFGEKVFKVPVALAGDCPNRAGLKGMKVCIFCDEWGSFAYPENIEKTLTEQITKHRDRVARRFRSQKFLVYFQAYTTTFLGLSRLKEAMEIALTHEGVVGVVLGTRSDCLSAALLDFLDFLSQKTFVAVELGVQSFDDVQLKWMERGHTSGEAIQGVQKIQKSCPRVNLGIHLMFGWPNETDEDIINSAKICNELRLDNVKLHNLHVLKRTPLEVKFNAGEFTPVEKDQYFYWVGLFLKYLSPQIAVHRLTAIASRWEDLVAPQWTRYKMTNYQESLSYLNANSIQQGSHYETPS